jgi:hypothetical protein
MISLQRRRCLRLAMGPMAASPPGRRKEVSRTVLQHANINTVTRPVGLGPPSWPWLRLHPCVFYHTVIGSCSVAGLAECWLTVPATGPRQRVHAGWSREVSSLQWQASPTPMASDGSADIPGVNNPRCPAGEPYSLSPYKPQHGLGVWLSGGAHGSTTGWFNPQHTKKIKMQSWVPVVHACNPSYLRGLATWFEASLSK